MKKPQDERVPRNKRPPCACGVKRANYRGEDGVWRCAKCDAQVVADWKPAA